MEVKTLPREFEYNGMKLADPNPALSPEEVRDAYSATYEDLATASIVGPDATGNTLRYTFVVAIGSKG